MSIVITIYLFIYDRNHTIKNINLLPYRHHWQHCMAASLASNRAKMLLTWTKYYQHTARLA